MHICFKMVGLQEYVDRKVQPLLQAMREAHERNLGLEYGMIFMGDVKRNIFDNDNKLRKFCNAAGKFDPRVSGFLKESEMIIAPYCRILIGGGD